jgi:hypothetical protein
VRRHGSSSLSGSEKRGGGVESREREMPLESSITKSIVTSAKARGWWTFKIAGGPMQTSGIPDLLCIKHGRAVFLEVKQPGKKPTPIQEQRIREIRTTGGARAEVVVSRSEAERILDDEDCSRVA